MRYGLVSAKSCNVDYCQLVVQLLVLGHFHSFNSFTPKEYVEFYLAGLLALQTGLTGYKLHKMFNYINNFFQIIQINCITPS